MKPPLPPEVARGAALVCSAVYTFFFVFFFSLLFAWLSLGCIYSGCFLFFFPRFFFVILGSSEGRADGVLRGKGVGGWGMGIYGVGCMAFFLGVGGGGDGAEEVDGKM